MNRFVLIFAVVVLAAPSLSGILDAQSATRNASTAQSGQQSSGPTPFSFVQRNDVRNEVGVTDGQLALVEKYQPVCDAICQAAVNEQLDAMPESLQAIYASMPFRQRMEAKGNLEQDIQESTELGMLNSQILTSGQMSRFGQLWTQQSGLGGFMSGNTSRAIGVSEQQKSQISQFQNIASQSIDACLANPNLSSAQQNVQIQQIQNITINQSINILSAEQINIYVGLCGEKFDLGEGDEGDGTDDGTDGEGEVADGGTEGEDGKQNEEGSDASKKNPRGDGSSREGSGPKRIAGLDNRESNGSANGQSRRVPGFGREGSSSGSSNSSNRVRGLGTGSSRGTSAGATEPDKPKALDGTK